MRREHRKLLKRAKEKGISETFINQYLMDEDKTDKELEKIYYQLYNFKDKGDDWIIAYMGIEEKVSRVATGAICGNI